MPNFTLENSVTYFNELNQLTENTALLDLEFSDKIAKFYKQSSYGKYKVSTRDIVGNNSYLYNKKVH